jgi:hypothetical protein
MRAIQLLSSCLAPTFLEKIHSFNHILEDPPSAYLHHQGSFMQDFSNYPSQLPGIDYAIFPFPTIDPAYSNAVMGGGDMAVMLNDSTEARAFINFLITTEAADTWVDKGRSGGMAVRLRAVALRSYGLSQFRRGAGVRAILYEEVL